MKRFVRVLIKDASSTRYLVLKEKKRKGVWNFPGGKVELEEKMEHACIRETEEETSLQVCGLQLLMTACFKLNHVEWQGYYYLANEVKGELLLKEKGILEMTYFTKAEIESNDNVFLSSISEHI